MTNMITFCSRFLVLPPVGLLHWHLHFSADLFFDWCHFHLHQSPVGAEGLANSDLRRIPHNSFEGFHQLHMDTPVNSFHGSARCDRFDQKQVYCFHFSLLA